MYYNSYITADSTSLRAGFFLHRHELEINGNYQQRLEDCNLMSTTTWMDGYRQWHPDILQFITSPVILPELLSFYLLHWAKVEEWQDYCQKTLWQILIRIQAFFFWSRGGYAPCRINFFNPLKSCQVSFNLLTVNYMFLHPSVWGLSFSMNDLLSVPLTIIAGDIHTTNQILISCPPEIVNIILCFALSLKYSNYIFA